MKTIVPKDKGRDKAAKERKAMEETEDFHPKKVCPELAKKIVNARIEKKWTRKDLARAVNEKEAVIASYENCTAMPDNKVISKIRRILKIT